MHVNLELYLVQIEYKDAAHELVLSDLMSLVFLCIIINIAYYIK